VSDGEKPKIREAMDGFVKRLTEGGVSTNKAQEIARREAQKADRRERDKR
jgi:hypothetical protein